MFVMMNDAFYYFFLLCDDRTGECDENTSKRTNKQINKTDAIIFYEKKRKMM